MTAPEDLVRPAAPAAAPTEVAAHVPLPRWAAPASLLFAVGLVPWTVWLAVTLPRRQTTRHYDLTWVGFDVALVLALTALMWLAHRRSTYVEIAATLAGTLLVVDAWFDITGSATRSSLLEAIASAVIFELPIAATCGWLALHAEAVRRRRDIALIRRRDNGLVKQTQERADNRYGRPIG